jgi:hypothetical protein
MSYFSLVRQRKEDKMYPDFFELLAKRIGSIQLSDGVAPLYWCGDL